jgi:hypothetical protein
LVCYRLSDLLKLTLFMFRLNIQVGVLLKKIGRCELGK